MNSTRGIERTEPRHEARRAAGRLAAFYVVIGVLYIFLSDYALSRLVRDSSLIWWFEAAKGTAFFLITGFGLYRLLRTEFQRRIAAADEMADDLSVQRVVRRLLDAVIASYETRDPAQLATSCLRAVVDHMPEVDAMAMHRFATRDGGRAHSTVVVSPDGKILQHDLGPEAFKHGAERGVVVNIPDILKVPGRNVESLRNRIGNLKVRSLVDLPLLEEAARVSFHSVQTHAFDNVDSDRLQALVAALGVAFDRMDELLHIQGRLDYDLGIEDTLSQMLLGSTVEGTLAGLVNAVVRAIPAIDLGAVYLWNAQSGCLVPRYCIGYDRRAFLDIRLASGESIAGKVFASNEPFHSVSESEAAARRGALSESNRELFAAACGGRKPASNVCCPLPGRDGRPLGVLTLSSSKSILTREHYGLIRSVATNAALVVEYAAANEGLEEALEARESLLQQIVSAQETERQTIARELHDELGQVLSVALLSLDTLSDLGQTGSEPFDRARESISDALTRVRDLSLRLRPSVLDDFGVAAALRWMVDRLQTQPGVPRLLSDIEETRHRFPEHVEAALFRIVQEALTNAIRHSRAETIRVGFKIDGEAAVVEVEDDGVGFDYEQGLSAGRAGHSCGLLSMEGRARNIGASLDVSSRVGGPTRIALVVSISTGLQ